MPQMVGMLEVPAEVALALPTELLLRGALPPSSMEEMADRATVMGRWISAAMELGWNLCVYSACLLPESAWVANTYHDVCRSGLLLCRSTHKYRHRSQSPPLVRHGSSGSLG
jgi:hypothetical protein